LRKRWGRTDHGRESQIATVRDYGEKGAKSSCSCPNLGEKIVAKLTEISLNKKTWEIRKRLKGRKNSLFVNNSEYLL